MTDVTNKILVSAEVGAAWFKFGQRIINVAIEAGIHPEVGTERFMLDGNDLYLTITVSGQDFWMYIPADQWSHQTTGRDE